MASGSFEDLVAEAVRAPVEGWDFSWLVGRTSGPDTSWSYPSMARAALASARRVLDVDTGGGELLASLTPLPAGTIACEAWPPNVPIARERLAPLGVIVFDAAGTDLPAANGALDLVLNRHGCLDAEEIARVVAVGGVLLSQQVGSDDCVDLNAALGAPMPESRSRPWNASVAASQLARAGMTVTDVREEMVPFIFGDIGAVVFQLRAVPWQIPDFSIERYDTTLRQLHRLIADEGSFTAHAHRFLVRAVR